MCSTRRGSLTRLGCNYLVSSVLVVRLATGFDAAGMLALAMAIANLVNPIADFRLRTVQVTDVTGERTSREYVGLRSVLSIVAFLVGVVYSVVTTSYDALPVISLYLVYSLATNFIEVFHAIDQRHLRLDFAGKSYVMQGIGTLVAFAVGLWFFDSLLVAVGLMTAVVILAVHGRGSTTEENTALIAYTLFTSAIVFCIATIANDNLQDLKTGQLVGATPWKQQVALVIGVVFGSLIIPPVLELMQNSFGFQGAPGASPDALAAPQASLISSLAKGVLGGGIDWKLLGIGAAIGVVVIIIDEVLRPASKGKLALPPLAVGMGIYLPASLTILIPIGGLIGFLYNRWADKQADVERAKRFGTLAATGLIVGESLFGVVYAGIAGATGSESPLALPFIGDGFTPVANVLGIVFFAGATWLLYGFARKITRDSDRESAAK